MKKIVNFYRIEDDCGIGFYQSRRCIVNSYRHAKELFTFENHPEPRSDIIGWDIQKHDVENFIFGFADFKQLIDWVPGDIFAMLMGAGFITTEYQAEEKHLMFGHKQICCQIGKQSFVKQIDHEKIYSLYKK